MNRTLGIIAATLLLGSALTGPASAQLLGGALDNIVDVDTDDGISIDVLDDTATVTLGGGGGNVVDADVLGDTVTANVNTSDGVNVDAGILDNTATASVNVGGSDGLIDADVNIGGDDDSGGGSGGGGSGGGGSGGSGGGSGGSGGGSGGSGGGGAVAGIGSGSQVPIGYSASCRGQNAGPVLNLIAQSRAPANTLSNWSGNINVTIIGLCSDLREQAMRLAEANGIRDAQGAASANPAVTAVLSQRSRSAGDILAFGVDGGKLHIYVR